MTTRSRRPAASSRRTLPRPALPAPPAADVERHGEPAAGPAQRSVGSPLPAARPADILALQRAAGNRQVQRALAARRLLSPAAPRGSASVIQRLRIVEDKKTGKLREAKADEEDALDVAKMTPGQRAIYRERIRTEKSVKLGEQFDLALKKSTPALDNIEDIYTINDELEALELSQKSKQPLDASLVKSIAAKLQDAQILLQTLQRGEDIVLYRGVVAEYTIRLSALDPKQKIGAVVEGQRAQIAITPADRQAYRDDVVNSVAWGGLAEANRVAEHLNLRVSIFRIDSKGRYQRVITIGPPGGQNHGIDLLHLGDHYVAVRGALAGQPEGGERDEQLKTKPDGNCLYEALYIAAHQAKPTDIQRQAFIANIRQWLSQALSDAEIDASIVAIVSQGDVAGLGPKTKTVLAAKSRAEKVRQYDEKTLAQLTKPLTQLDQADQFGYQEKAATYLAERKKKPDSDETAAAFDALERALSSARHVLDMRRWATKTGDIVLPMGWWEPVRAGMPKRATANAKLLLESLTGARDAVVKYNLGAGAPKLDIRGLLEMLDAIEDKMKRMAAPGAEPDALQEDAREAAKIAIYRFVTEDVRLARARLVHLFQLAEGSTFRTGGPGLRPDLHYDFYPETEKAEGQGARATYAPKGFGKAESQLVTSMIDPKGSQPKGMQEGLSAVALKQAYPARFSNIVRSEDPHVEYFDNDGMPWDQKAPVSHGRVTTEEIMTGISGKLHESYGYRLDRKAGEYIPDPNARIGIVLDCTYMNHNDYVRLWAALIKRCPADVLRTHLVEINVPFAAEDKTVRAQPSKDRTNTSILDGCRVGSAGQFKAVGSGSSGTIYAVSRAKLTEHVPGLGGVLETISANKDDTIDKDDPVYRNHNFELPNRNSYFLAFYSGANDFPDGSKVRLIYDKPNKLFYITGTHYNPWMPPYGDEHIRNPFFLIEE